MKDRASAAVHLFLISLTAATAVQAADYSITDLGLGSPTDINDAGSVVGLDPQNVAWYYHGSRVALTSILVDFTNPMDPNHTPDFSPIVTFASIRINNSEHVRGFGFVARYGFDTIPYGFDYLPAPDGGPGTVGYTFGGGLNYDPEVVAFNDNGLSAYTYHAFYDLGFWGIARYAKVGGTPVGAAYAVVNALNNAGLAAGEAAAAEPVTFPGHFQNIYPARACIVSNGVVQFIDPRDPGATDPRCCNDPDFLSYANAINSQGHVAGTAYGLVPPAGGPLVSANSAFIYRGGGMEQLMLPGGAGIQNGSLSMAADINDSDQIIGIAWNSNINVADMGPFLWDNGVATNLNSLLPSGSGWVLTSATAINNRGQIVGQGAFQGAVHAFLLSPVSLGVAPRISSQPTGQVLTIRESYQLSVVATGTAPINYQWLRDDDILKDQTNVVLNISSASGADVGTYRVVVSNGNGSVTSNLARIDVLDAKLSIANGADGTYPLTITGEAGGHYRLEYTGSPDGTGGWTTVASLTLTNAVQVYPGLRATNFIPRFYRCARLQ